MKRTNSNDPLRSRNDVTVLSEPKLKRNHGQPQSTASGINRCQGNRILYHTCIFYVSWKSTFFLPTRRPKEKKAMLRDIIFWELRIGLRGFDFEKSPDSHWFLTNFLIMKCHNCFTRSLFGTPQNIIFREAVSLLKMHGTIFYYHAPQVKKNLGRFLCLGFLNNFGLLCQK